VTGAPLYDAVVIGGGPAGLTAALYLARSRRRTLVLDAGQPRNARAAFAHGVFTRDGIPPGELLAAARRQLAGYPDVTFRPVGACSAAPRGGRFEVELADGGAVEARRLLIASGLRDELPPIPGVADLWGRRVHLCSYCHGYEERDRPLAVLAEGDAARAAVASLLPLSRDLVLCTNGSALSPNDRERIAAHGVRFVESRLIEAADAQDGLVLHFENGLMLERSALFLKSRPRIAGDLPARLGCALDGPARVVVDATWRTTVPGVYAAGDIAAEKKFVATAAASGAEAAVGLDGGLAQEDFGGAWQGPLCASATASSPPAGATARVTDALDLASR
jgi:thioredoxin reductase